MQEGTIIKGYSGFYYVRSGDCTFECSLRGRLRLQEQNFLPGDRVKFTPTSSSRGVIEAVLPRVTELTRPPVANVDQVVIIQALASPEPNLALLDRMLVLAEHVGLDPLVCLNKADLVTGGSVENMVATYQQAGYRVLLTSALTGTGVAELKQHLRGRISVFAGPSGVGKTSLLNAVQPGLSLKTGAVSRKQRGRHTTRHVELLDLEGGGLVADTPGFSNLELPVMARKDLMYDFPEIGKRAHQCRFSSCLHIQEPGCAVKEAVAAGEVAPSRYNHYREFLEEVQAKEKRY